MTLLAGRHLLITSIQGESGEELSLSYDISKAGLNAATRTLAIELGPHGVRVNAIGPGLHTHADVTVDGGLSVTF